MKISIIQRNWLKSKLWLKIDFFYFISSGKHNLEFIFMSKFDFWGVQNLKTAQYSNNTFKAPLKIYPNYGVWDHKCKKPTPDNIENVIAHSSWKISCNCLHDFYFREAEWGHEWSQIFVNVVSLLMILIFDT